MLCQKRGGLLRCAAERLTRIVANEEHSADEQAGIKSLLDAGDGFMYLYDALQTVTVGKSGDEDNVRRDDGI